MKRRNHLGLWGLAGTCAWALIACSGHEGAQESVARSELAATRGKGVTLPVPKNAPTPWRASELLFADALATCASKPGDPERERGGALQDASLGALRTKMQATMAAQESPLPTWRAMRADSNRNTSSFSNAPTAQVLGSQYPEAYDIEGSALLNPAVAELQPIFDGVGVNLCIARGIYEQTRF
jgi:hypothetical protein